MLTTMEDFSDAWLKTLSNLSSFITREDFGVLQWNLRTHLDHGQVPIARASFVGCL